MITIRREKAIEILSKEQLKVLDKDDRKSYILNWWVLDEDDEEFTLLSSNLQVEILENEDFMGDPIDNKYDELIMVGLASLYRGVTNEFLSQSISIVTKTAYKVIGELEVLYLCPCCSHYTLDSVGEYDICPLCKWEDDLTTELDDYSAPNDSTLGQARIDFMRNLHNVPLFKYNTSLVNHCPPVPMDYPSKK